MMTGYLKDLVTGRMAQYLSECMHRVPLTREQGKLLSHCQLLQRIFVNCCPVCMLYSEKATNRQCLLKILSNLRFLARR